VHEEPTPSIKPDNRTQRQATWIFLARKNFLSTPRHVYMYAVYIDVGCSDGELCKSTLASSSSFSSFPTRSQPSKVASTELLPKKRKDPTKQSNFPKYKINKAKIE
jgi:hypothetical protein